MAVNGRCDVSLELLGQPARRVVRVVAAARLDVVREAWTSLNAGEADALHDLRVSLRRLRTWIRAFRPLLDDTLRGKTRRRLHKLVRSTNAARDLEVWAAWANECGEDEASRRMKAGSRYLRGRFDQESRDAADQATARLQKNLPRLIDDLADELSEYWCRVPVTGDPPPEETMAQAVADVVRASHHQFERRVQQAKAADDGDAAHRARIAGKRLRYILETLTPFEEARETANALSELQDTLGVVHDMRLLAERIADELASGAAADIRRLADGSGRATKHAKRPASAAPSFARAKSGLLELHELARRQSRDAFKRFRRTWTGGEHSGLGKLDAAMASLDQHLGAL